MAMFQYCDHMYFYAYSAIICVCTSRCRSVAGFYLHRISISSSTCVCLSELHHITSSCSSSASSALLTEAAPGDASCTCQISQMSSDATTLTDELWCCNCFIPTQSYPTSHEISGKILFPKKDPILLNLLALEWEKIYIFKKGTRSWFSSIIIQTNKVTEIVTPNSDYKTQFEAKLWIRLGGNTNE